MRLRDSREGKKKTKSLKDENESITMKTESIKLFKDEVDCESIKTLISDVINYNSDIKYKESESKNNSRKRTM